MIKIREVRVSDSEQFTALLQSLVDENPPVALELEPLIAKGRQWIATFPSGESGHFVIAEDTKNKGVIIGFCYLAIPKFYKPIAYIGVAVKKEYRKHDIATMMFQHIVGWAEGRRLQYIFADIWSWNEGSLKFFKALGFKEKEVFKDKFKGEEKNKVRMIMNIWKG